MVDILNPPIKWRFFVVYWRHTDGRIKYFRGQRRRELFVRNATSDWMTEPECARLFEEPLKNLTNQNFAKVMRSHPLRTQLSWRGFDGIVLSSHLIMPPKKGRQPPG